MKTEIWISFNYGAWSLIFSKNFELPFTPFYGLYLLDTVDDNENEIHFDKNDYCDTSIEFDVLENSFLVNIRNVWKHPVRDDVVDDIISLFSNTKWKREDRTDIKELKELMNRNVNN